MEHETFSMAVEIILHFSLVADIIHNSCKELSQNKHTQQKLHKALIDKLFSGPQLMFSSQAG